MSAGECFIAAGLFSIASSIKSNEFDGAICLGLLLNGLLKAVLQ